MTSIKRYATIALVLGALAVALICWFRLRLAERALEHAQVAHVRTIAERDGLLKEATRRRFIAPPAALKEVVDAGARIVARVEAVVVTKGTARGDAVVHEVREVDEGVRGVIEASDEHQRFHVVIAMDGTSQWSVNQRWKLSGVELGTNGDAGTRWWSVSLDEVSPKDGSTLGTYVARATEITGEYVETRRTGLRRLGWTAGIGGGVTPTGESDVFVGAMYGWRF